MHYVNHYKSRKKTKQVNWSTLVVVIFDLSSDMVPEQGTAKLLSYSFILSLMHA